MSARGEYEVWRKGTTFPKRVGPPCIERESLPSQGLKIGDTVELRSGNSSHSDHVPVEQLERADDERSELQGQNRDFFRIASIIENVQNDSITLRGYRLRRTKQIDDLLPKRLNEVCIMATYNEDDPVDPRVQSLEDIALSEVLKDARGRCILRKLIITNALEPQYSFRDDERDTFYYFDERLHDAEGRRRERRHIAQEKVLVCRWVWWNHLKAITVSRIKEVEADLSYRIRSRDVIERFSGRVPASKETYTFGDAFCGAGGFTQGAKAAGVDVRWGVDMDGKAIMTWRLNCPCGHGIHSDFFNFLERLRRSPEEAMRYLIDILHLSLPCQWCSPANTRSLMKDPTSAGGMRDETNQAAIFSIQDALTILRPRIVTVEETSGLEQLSRHRPFLIRMIGMFTDCGYSVAMKVVNMLDYGVPQPRKRVIIIASCPGTSLPSFPKKTHGDLRDRPVVTVNECLEQNLPGGNVPLRNIVTTKGTADENFTIAQLQRLCTFPDAFRFPAELRDSDKKRQLGNAVPPLFAKVLVKSIVKSLKKDDEEWRKQTEALRQQSRNTLLEIQDDGSVRETVQQSERSTRYQGAGRGRRESVFRPASMANLSIHLRKRERSESEDSLTEDETGRRRKTMRKNIASGSKDDPVCLD